MNWIKSPFPWQSWGKSTLLASLSLHGLLLSLPLAAEKEPPKPETLAAVPIAALPAEPAVEPPAPLPEPEPTVQPPPQPPEPLFEESKPLFDRFPSWQFSSFRDRSISLHRQPVEEIEPLEETEKILEDPSYSTETEVRKVVETTTSTTESIEPETLPQKTRVDTNRFDRPLKTKPKLQPSQLPLAEEEPPEVVKSQLQAVLGDIRGEGDFSEVKGIDIFAMIYGFSDLDRLEQSFTTDNKNDLKPEIDPHQFRVIEDRKPDDVIAKLQNELSSQKFSITPVTNPVPGVYENSDLYEVKKGSVVSYVNLVDLGETGTLFVVWNQLPN